MRLIFAILLVIASLQTANAQATVTPAPVAPAAPSAADINKLAAELNDPAARQKLIDQLQLLANAQKAAEPEVPTVEGFGAHIYGLVRSHLDSVDDEASELEQAFSDFPRLIRIIDHRLDDPATSAAWTGIGATILLVFSASLVAYALGRLAIHRVCHRLSEVPPQTLWRRLGLALGRFLIICLPVAAFTITGYGLITYLALVGAVQAIALELVNATVVFLIMLAFGRFLLSPHAPNLRIMPSIGDGGSLFLYSWGRRLTALGIYSYFILQTAELLGLPHAAMRALLKIAGLIFASLLSIIVLQNRRPVTAWLRRDRIGRLRLKHLSTLSGARYFFAGFWHVFALAFIVVTFLTWTFNLEGGPEYILHSTGGTLLAIIAGRLLIVIIDQITDRSLGLSEGVKARFPGLEARANRYMPVLRSALHWLIIITVVAVSIYAWRLDNFSWLTWHSIIVQKALSILLVLAIAIVIWEIVASTIERILLGGPTVRARVERSARLRTLLPLLRNFCFIFILTITGMVILSEVGIDTRPLLAGAGVIGVAIGFGSQTLVKDVITGIFILFENTIAIGEVVDLGSGHSGVVEGLSIRTLRIRDDSGGIHTVPFSQVNTIINLSRDHSAYVFDVTVNYREDTDRVVEIIKTLGAELQADPAFAKLILAPLDIWGVDSFKETGVSIKAGLKTLPLQQWGIVREFNRRIKKRFDELGIRQAMPRRELFSDGFTGKASLNPTET